MQKPAPDFLEILRALLQYRVDFIVVGGVCAVLHGAPVATFDLDLVHCRASDNLERLMAALNDLDAYFRERPDQRLRPKPSHLASPGHQLLMTRFGPLDLLGAIGNKRSYKDLILNTVELQVGELSLRILTLETLIETKKAAGRDKDRAVLSLLRQTLKEKLRL